MKTDSLFRK